VVVFAHFLPPTLAAPAIYSRGGENQAEAALELEWITAYFDCGPQYVHGNGSELDNRVKHKEYFRLS
jgi:hypothetical protein